MAEETANVRGEQQSPAGNASQPESEGRSALEALKQGLDEANNGRMAESIAHFDEAIKLDPAYGEAYNCKGLVLMELKKVDEAFSCFGAALKISPENPKYWYNKSTFQGTGHVRGRGPGLFNIAEVRP